MSEETTAVATEEPVVSTAPVSEPAKADEDTILGGAGSEEEAPATEEATDQETATAPEAYEFKVPEGMTLDAGLVDQITPVFNELGISQDGAQKLVDIYAPYVQKMIEGHSQAAIAEYKEVVSGWKQETQKELGAEAKIVMAKAAKAINKYGPPELRTLLNETGVGNHKELVKFFGKVGDAISEDSFVEGNKTTDLGSIKASDMYPSMKK